MPVGPLEAHCQRTLDEIVAISQHIRRSALAFANNQTSNQNFNIVQKLRRQLETIRTSSDTILEAITFKNYTIDDRIIDWLFSGELRSCLDKLKEMNDILKSDGQVRPALALARPLTQAEDKLTAAMAFFDKHNCLFYFLLTPDVWNHGGSHCQASQVDTLCIAEATKSDPQEIPSQTTSSIATEYAQGEGDLLSDTGRAVTTGQNKELLQQKLDEVSRWLVALDCTEKHKDTHRLRQEGTCTWFPGTDAYKKWRAGGNRFLWLHGKAGCGKSVLVASTIEHLKNTLEDGEVVTFFYCDFRNQRSMGSTEVMRSLLYQLFCHIGDCGVDPGDFPNKILEEKSKGTLLLNDLDKLCDLVSRAASFFRYEPIIVIDALDECTDIKEFLSALVKLHQADVRLLVTSRPDQNIARHFAGLPSLSLENVAKELAADIALHVRRELDSHNRLRSAELVMKSEINAKLNERAEGRFRWVQCQLDTLKRCTTRVELKEALDNLPNELEATYERILGAIDERKLEGKLARRALAWLVVALEPLRLAQVVEGFSVDLKQRKVNLETQSLGVALLDALSSLASYHEETDVLALSHFSVKEYLTSCSTLPTYHIISLEAHAEVAEMCMRYITFFLKQGPSCGNVLPLESFPMLSYVLSSGFNHIAHVDPRSTVILEALQSLGLDVRHHPSHWDRLCELREEDLRWPYPPWPSSRHDFVLCILIAHSSVRLLQSYLSGHFPLKPRLGTNPLVYATDLGKTEHAMALLACGASVDVRSLVVDSSHQALPLEVAINLGEDMLIGELLQRGCVVTSEVLTTAVCMPWCSTRVLAKLIQTDEFVEWANEIGDEKLYRGVFNSARPNAGDGSKTDEDHVTLARRLCQIGQDLSADSPFGGELIERAVHAAHTSMLEYLLPPDQPPPPRFLLSASTGDTSETVSVIRFLLQRGVDIDAVSDGRGDTALHLAAICPWEPRSLELTQILIDAGCNPHARNLEDETPWIIAAERGYSSVVELLISCNVPLPPDMLVLALQKRSAPKMMQSLLCKRANVHSTTSDGDTILHLVIAMYTGTACRDLVKSFIEAGCDPTACNSKGNTALEVAFERGDTSMVELLLSCNVPLPSDILLFALRKRSTSQMIQFLMHKGAGVHFTMPDGNTVLHFAIAKYAGRMRRGLMKGFIEAGCSPTARNSKGNTALEAAIERRDTSVVELLLSCSVPLPPDILLFALRKCSSPQMIQFLVHEGGDVHSTTSNGDTVLHLAIAMYVEETCWDLVKSLVEAGCNPAACNSEGETVLEVAIEREYISVVEFLLSCNVPFPPDILLFALRKRSDPQTIHSLICNGADVHSTTSDGDTVLHLAIAKYVETTCWDLVRSLVRAGCTPTTRNSKGNTVLEATIEREHTSVVELLLSHNVHLPSGILLFALRQPSTPKMIQFLIRKGANVHSITTDGDTVLHLAIAKYFETTCWGLVKNFIEAGCSPTACNSKGSTVLEAAIERKYTSVVNLLLSYNVPFPSNILPFALQKTSTPQIIQSLICRGAHVHSTTSDGDTILHLAIAEYAEVTCCHLVKSLIVAGCNPTSRNSKGQTVLEAAIQREYIWVVELLLSRCNVPFPPDILLFAVRQRSTLMMIRSLVRNGADRHATMFESRWDDLIQLVHASYSRQDCQQIVEFLGAARKPAIPAIHVTAPQ